MGKTILTLLVLISAGLAQTFTEGSPSTHHSEEVGAFPGAPQSGEAESFHSGAALISGVAPSVPVSVPRIRAEVQEVNLTFTVTDRHGHFVHDLAPSDFTLQDNGEPPARITYFESQSELPLRLAIAIDSSTSVAGAFGDEKRSAAAFLKHILRPQSDLALILRFNQDVQIVQQFASDNKLLSPAIRHLRSGGNTAIYDAVSAATQQLAKVKDTQTTRRVIVLITDGEDNSSHISLGQAEEIAQRSECVVYVIGVNLETGSNSESGRAMKELSQVTGGDFLSVRAVDGLIGAFSKIEKELRNQYFISYKPASVNPDGSFHRLVLSGPKKLRIHCRDGYFAR